MMMSAAKRVLAAAVVLGAVAGACPAADDGFVPLFDVKTAELKNDKGRTEGHIALQLHGGQDMRVEVKGLKLLTRAPAGAK